MTSDEVVAAALAACGGNKETLARRLGEWRQRHGLKEAQTMTRVRSLDRWREPDGPKPDFYSTVALLEIGGLLVKADANRILEPSAEEVVEVLSMVAEFLERLVPPSHGSTPPPGAMENGS